ncbi:MAG: hypothetical protein C0592_10325 [Marinilabiliales bacterium]|nr:MAG: hypothetical protein C0592_10325 [Marinilabiliales bacterium]
MIRFFFASLFLLIGIVSFSQQYYSLSNPAGNSINIVSSTPTETIIEFNFDGFYLNDVNTPQGIKKAVSMNGASQTLAKGEPEVLTIARSIIIPDNGSMDFKILESSFLEFPNIEIVPSKGNLYRDVDPSTVPFEWGRTYQEDGVFPASPVMLSDPYILRDYRGMAIRVFPVQYNDANQSIKVYKKIVVKISHNPNTAGVNEFNRTKSMQTVDEQFDALYNGQFLNYNSIKYTAIAERGNMLIIADPSFASSMAPFVQWKNRIGFPTEIVTTSTTGTSNTAIKSYVTNYYNTNGLTHLLFVGDGNHIPVITSGMGGPSDNAYAYITGNDHYPEFYVGRFSVESTADVDVMVERSITYELDPYTGSDWLNRNLGIASDQGPGDDNEYDYQHIRNIQADLIGYEYTTSYELFDGSQGGLDASGDPSAANVSTVLNGTGVGIINYTGHGSDYSFVTTGFSNTNVNALTNTEAWPFIFSVACVNGNFVSQTCFAEAWLRAKDTNGDPTGAVAVIMSTINQSWDPPMEGQDEMNDVLCELNAGNIKHTFAGIAMSGCMKMNDTYGSGGEDMTDTWTIFGDPSLMVRTDTAKSMTVTHNPTTFIGATSFTVNCNVEGAFVTITLNDQILGTGTITGGSANISFAALPGIDTLVVAVTKYNYIPYIGEVPVIAASGPYVVYESHTINDAAGNNNGVADYQESFLINMTLNNVGISNASSVVGNISTSDAAITITDTTENYGTINSSSTATQNNAYAVSVGDVDDGHIATFNLNSISGGNNWGSTFNISINAPDLAIGNLSVDDVSGGNGDYKLDPGETADIIIESFNNGHANYASAGGTLTSTSPYVTINNGSASLGNLTASGSANANFNITISAGATLGSNIDLTYTLGTGYYQVQVTFYLKVGIVSEDWESGDMTMFAWSTSGNQPWFVTTENPYEGTYCVKSGAITDNQSSTLSITMDCATADSISFYRKVSCEEGSAYGSQWDYLEFKIGSTSKDWWDGEQAWERFAYATAAGNQTFSWVYEKDYYVSEFDDCAWVDYIVFPPIAIPTGVEEAEFTFNVYPNPSTDNAFIEIFADGKEHIRIELINELGQLNSVIYNGEIQAGVNKISVDLTSLSQGVYFIKVIGESGSSARMLMIGH